MVNSKGRVEKGDLVILERIDAVRMTCTDPSPGHIAGSILSV